MAGRRTRFQSAPDHSEQRKPGRPRHRHAAPTNGATPRGLRPSGPSDGRDRRPRLSQHRDPRDWLGRPRVPLLLVQVGLVTSRPTRRAQRDPEPPQFKTPSLHHHLRQQTDSTRQPAVRNQRIDPGASRRRGGGGGGGEGARAQRSRWCRPWIGFADPRSCSASCSQVPTMRSHRLVRCRFGFSEHGFCLFALCSCEM